MDFHNDLHMPITKIENTWKISLHPLHLLAFSQIHCFLPNGLQYSISISKTENDDISL